MLTRREFAAVLLAATARSRPAAATLYDRSFVLDCNTMPNWNELPSRDELQLLRTSGLHAVKASLGGATGGFEQAVADVAFWSRAIEFAPNELMQVRRPSDLDRTKREKKLGLIYGFESAAMLESDLKRIDLFRNLGVMVMQLTYNRTSPFGVGCLDGDSGGLTALGRDAVARMNADGVALDLSHSNTETTADGIAMSKKPVIISHAGCRAIHQHPRNKEDRELRALADRGGVIGIFMLPFLTPSPQQPTLEIYMKHMTHALDVCGEDHVGIGTDITIEPFDDRMLGEVRKDIERRKAAGVSAPGEDRPPYIPDLNTPRKLEKVADALMKRGYSPRVAEKVLGKNFRRVFGEIWTA